MKVELLMRDRKPVLRLDYDVKSYKVIEGKFKALGLKKAKTIKGFDGGLALDYYREDAEQLLRYLSRCDSLKRINLIDDVNKSVYDGSNFNIALFRVIPINGVVEVPCGSYLSILDLQRVTTSISSVYSALIGLVTKASINFNIKPVPVVMTQ